MTNETCPAASAAVKPPPGSARSIRARVMAALSCRNISLIPPSVVSDARALASRLVDAPRAPPRARAPGRVPIVRGATTDAFATSGATNARETNARNCVDASRVARRASAIRARRTARGRVTETVNRISRIIRMRSVAGRAPFSRIPARFTPSIVTARHGTARHGGVVIVDTRRRGVGRHES